METTPINIKTIAACGLYCANCSKYTKGKCPGCRDNLKASWCSIKTCVLDKGITSCADCNEFSNVKDCKKFNNFIGRAFGFVFNSDRKACIDMIRQDGYEKFVDYMALNSMVTMKRRK